MPRVHVYGYARNITEMETAKSEAVQSLRENLAKPYRIWRSSGSAPGDGCYLPPLPRHEPDPSGLTFTLYRHGGLNLQVDYEFEYPEPADPVRCPKCGGPHPFHDPACVVHPDLIQDQANGRSER